MKYQQLQLTSEYMRVHMDSNMVYAKMSAELDSRMEKLQHFVGDLYE